MCTAISTGAASCGAPASTSISAPRLPADPPTTTIRSSTPPPIPPGEPGEPAVCRPAVSASGRPLLLRRCRPRLLVGGGLVVQRLALVHAGVGRIAALGVLHGQLTRLYSTLPRRLLPLPRPPGEL